MNPSPTSSRNHFLSSLSLGLVQSPIRKRNTMFDYSDTKTTQNHDYKHTHLRLLDHIKGFDDSNFERRRYTSIDTKGKEGEDSGVCTPPLWRSRPPESPPRRHLHYRSLSPASRTQAIEKGQMELMEMVRNMPESCYELSLKDLVELPMARQDNFIGHSGTSTTNGVKNPGHSNRTAMRGKGSNKKKLDGSKPRMVRSGSLDSGGFMLKMVFPISWGQSKKKKDRDRDGGVGANKASLRPALSDGALNSGGGGGGGGDEKDWWKKCNSISGDSESGDSSMNTGSMKSSGTSSSSSRSSSIGESRRQQSGGCWSFILAKRANSPTKMK